MNETMSETQKERLSAFMDGETQDEREDQQVLDALLEDPETRGAWARYHLASDCMNGRLPRRLDRTLADRVAESLRNEPVILAPSRTWRGFVKPVAGFAIAASVATLAVLIALQNPEGVNDPGPASLAKVAPDPSAGGVAPAPVRAVSAGNPAERRPVARRGEPPRLSRYINDYRARRSGARISEGMPVVAVFIERTERPPAAKMARISQGRVNAFSLYTAGRHVIVVGEAPQAAVQQVAQSVISSMEGREWNGPAQR